MEEVRRCMSGRREEGAVAVRARARLSKSCAAKDGIAGCKKMVVVWFHRWDGCGLLNKVQ